MKAYGGVGVYIHIFLTSALAGGEWLASRSDLFTFGGRVHGTYWIGDLVDPWAGLDDVEKGKFLTLPRFGIPTLPGLVQRVASSYTDWAAPAHVLT
jgi:hypothetical protein